MPSDPITLIEIIQNYGPTVAAIAFFIWRDWKREERTVAQNENLNIFIRERLTKALEENTEAITTMVSHCQRYQPAGQPEVAK